MPGWRRLGSGPRFAPAHETDPRETGRQQRGRGRLRRGDHLGDVDLTVAGVDPGVLIGGSRGEGGREKGTAAAAAVAKVEARTTATARVPAAAATAGEAGAAAAAKAADITGTRAAREGGRALTAGPRAGVSAGRSVAGPAATAATVVAYLVENMKVGATGAAAPAGAAAPTESPGVPPDVWERPP